MPNAEPCTDARADDDEVDPFDHDARPRDYGEEGDYCKHCDEEIVWMGPSDRDWLHESDPRL